jgi:UDP-N-acetylmuramoyl-L-alanyl-D-glutamate--2,6-diaminopimelate ligase
VATATKLDTIGVTGTNGKTTTTTMVARIVAASGEPSARVTTLGSFLNDEQLSESTGVEAFTSAVERAIAAGVRTLALELTSKALAEGFARRWAARVAVFTNLSRDHLDQHQTPERYLAAKAQLFMALPDDGVAVVNASDPASALIAEVTPPAARRAAFAGLRGVAAGCEHLPLALALRAVSVARSGTRVELEPSPLASSLGGALELGVVGEVYAEDALAAAIAVHALGYAPAAIVRGLREFQGVPGRFERVWLDPLVVVDYAHTPDALARTLGQARELTTGRLTCVFGCGGERDVGKRPLMGRVAAELADRVFLTNDNPRNEDPDAILAAIAAGCAEAGEAPEANVRRNRAEVVLTPDRKEAIALALESAESGRGEAVVIAGKGHERTQWSGDRADAFSDVDLASELCRSRFAFEEK